MVSDVNLRHYSAEEEVAEHFGKTVQADPGLKVSGFQSLIAKRIHSAFNLNPLCF